MKQSADLVVFNGVVYTVNSSFETAEAFAVRDGRFVAVGSSGEIRSGYKGAAELDLRGKTVYPGFMDAHCHLGQMGQGLTHVDLRGASSFEEILERLQAARREHPERTVLLGDGWDQNLWEVKEFPDNTELNRLFPDVPVVLSRIDFHAVLANEAAIRKMGVRPDDPRLNREEAEFEGGRFTGIFLENLCNRFRDEIAEYSREEWKEIFLKAQQECFRNGLVAVCDAEEDTRMLQALQELDREGKLKLRTDAWLSATETNFAYYTEPYKGRNLNITTLKLYRDGALGSRGALLLDPYSDDPGNCGIEYSPLDLFRKHCLWADEHGFRVATHCIGDRANREALDVYAGILKGKNDRRWRIEHAQILHPEDVARFGEYSIVPSVQPTHCTSDMLWAAERLGTQRAGGAYIYKQLLDQLGWLPSGTDFPIEQVNPVYTFFAAVFRKNLDFVPEGGYRMENALTKEEALRSMTIWAARSVFEEDARGSIEPGKQADFVITDRDLMKVPEKEVPSVQVLSTYISGERVFGGEEGEEIG